MQSNERHVQQTVIRLPSVWEQTTILIRKWFLTLLGARARQQSTIYRALSGPIAFAFIFGYTRNLYVAKGHYGVSSPGQLAALSDAIGSDRLVYYGSDREVSELMRDIMRNATSGIPSGQIIELSFDEKEQLNTICRQNLRGYSSCYGAVEWHSADQSTGVYNYTLRGNAGMDYINVNGIDSDVDRYILPLQNALDSVITGDSQPVDTIAFTSRTDTEHEDDVRANYSDILMKYMCPIMFFLMINVIFHLVGDVAVEREAGIIDLLESMGCRRVSYLLGTHFAYSTIYIPGIIVGALAVWLTTFKQTNYGLILISHLLSLLSLVSWSLFLSSFFKKAQLSGVLSAGFSMVLAVMVVVQYATIGFNRAAAIVLSFLFPPMNYTYYIQTNAKWEKEQLSLNLVKDAPDEGIAAGILWIAAVFHIFAFLGLAYAVEAVRYPRNTRNSSTNAGPANPGAFDNAIELRNVRKVYEPWSRLSKKDTVVAVDSLSLDIKKGTITCLLGANGSGKTTTVEMISGIQRPTSGNITFSDPTAGVGICPQQNVYWGELSVEKNIYFFGKLKSTTFSEEELEDLLVQCDLYPKRNAQGSLLSGGQHRKLQLALMLAGGSKVCCIDEVSSGLDPLSRRKIWDILLSMRGERTIIICTHYLDEADILGDDVAIMSRGIIKVRGSPLELKESVGSGYRVSTYIPESGQETVNEFSAGSEVAEFIQELEQQGREFYVAGPQLEDVFMKIEAESTPEIAMLLGSSTSSDTRQAVPEINQKSEDVELTEFATDMTEKVNGEPRRVTSLVGQVWTMMLKRGMIAIRNPIPAFLAFSIPIIISGICSNFLKTMDRTTCEIGSQISEQKYQAYDLESPAETVIGSREQFDSYRAGLTTYYNASSTDMLSFNLISTADQLLPYVQANYSTLTVGMFIDPPSIAYQLDGNDGLLWGPSVFNMLRNTRANGTLEIIADYSPFQYPWTLSLVKSLQFEIYFTAALVAFPAFVSIYPASERLRKVKALEFSNGLKALAMWIAYLLFDFAFALLSCVICIGILSSADSALYGLGYFFVVLMFYSLAAILMAYLIAQWATSVLAAFAITVLAQAALFGLYLLAYFSISTYSAPDQIDSQILIVYFTMGVLCPAIHVVRGIFMLANMFGVLCNGDGQIALGDIRAYGGPITYLIVQSVVYFGLLIWMDTASIKSFGLRKKTRHTGQSTPGTPDQDSDVTDEIARVSSGAEKHGLRVMHVNKNFYGRHIDPVTAIADVTFGVRPGECFALLGPNGAGKTTLFNMVRGEARPTSGDILVEDVSVVKQRSKARLALGVCPQFDATELFSVEETLDIYARIKGIPGSEVRNVVEDMVQKIGLGRFKHRLASKLSGGNKRKLSLAIALLGNPPVILLDEPSSGLDAVSKRVMWHSLSSMAPGKSIVLTTHSMEEADALCNRAGILSKSMLAIGTNTHLRKRFGGGYVVHILCASAPNTSKEEIELLVNWARDRFPGMQLEERGYTGQLRFSVPVSGVNELSKDDVLGTLNASDIFRILEHEREVLGIRYYSVSQPSLEQVFLRIVGENNIVEEGYGEEQPNQTRRRSRWAWWRRSGV
ncbi:hypothetical protein V1517DRAFT_321269 [Lipomyces orientalis]|uniref:Uncharacterized protein n=1 Tax=Lipomyces orientalis TaxID=1233043 RepID=A0ACC3TPV4_9ASCO